MGLPIPVEAALHVHFDARAFVTAGSFAKLVLIFDASAIQLKGVVQYQPALRTSREMARRNWPKGLVEEPSFLAFELGKIARAQAQGVETDKYVDFNVMEHDHPLSEKQREAGTACDDVASI